MEQLGLDSFSHHPSFANRQDEFKLFVYYEIPALSVPDRQIERFVNECKKDNIICIIPKFSGAIPKNEESEPQIREWIAAMRRIYTVLLRAAKSAGIHIAFHLEPCVEEAVAHTANDIYEEELGSRILICREYYCARDEKVDIRVRTDGTLMALCAYDDDNTQVVDLRDNLENGRLLWDAPWGNWCIQEFFCVEDPNSADHVDILNYQACRRYLDTAYALFGDIFAPYMGKTLNALHYTDICFHAQNRRNWSECFNEEFKAQFGFDPAPYYPALYHFIGPDTPHYKALFMTCRARLLRDGILKALADSAHEHGLLLLGSVAEPKLPACSWLNGDAMADCTYAPGAVMNRAYLYGLNSVKLAAGAAYNYDHDRTTCEMFRGYVTINKDIAMRDTLNAFARGANQIMLHIPAFSPDDAPDKPYESSWLENYAGMVRNVQSLLRGGHHVADIAVLYPIEYLHSKVNFYEDDATGFEYPSTPSNANYMTVINSISMYGGYDVTVLHPEIFEKRCRLERNEIRLENKYNRERFPIFVLPACNMISLANARKLRDFFDAGGKVIGTGALPTLSFEFDGKGDGDREVRQIMEHIFGANALNTSLIEEYCYHKNDAGGEAYFLYFNMTGADGLNAVDCKTLSKAIASFAVPMDVYMPDMLRAEGTGALNNPYPEFKRLGMTARIPGGGMLTHIHKRRGGSEIYFFSNTTDRTYEGHVLLRGTYRVRNWNPVECKARRIGEHYVRYLGEVYAVVPLLLHSGESVFLTGESTATAHADIRDISRPEEINLES